MKKVWMKKDQWFRFSLILWIVNEQLPSRRIKFQERQFCSQSTELRGKMPPLSCLQSKVWGNYFLKQIYMMWYDDHYYSTTMLKDFKSTNKEVISTWFLNSKNKLIFAVTSYKGINYMQFLYDLFQVGLSLLLLRINAFLHYLKF